MNRRNFLERVALVGAAGAAVPTLVKVASAEGGVKEFVRFPDDPHGDVFERIPTPDVPEARCIVNRTAPLKHEIARLERDATLAEPLGGPVSDETDTKAIVSKPQPAFYEDRLTLLQVRGLMAPCPNCGENGTTWRRYPSPDGPFLECRDCGWRDAPHAYETPCPCVDCRADLTAWFDERDKPKLEDFQDYKPWVEALVEYEATRRTRVPRPPDMSEDTTLEHVQLNAQPGLYRVVESWEPFGLLHGLAAQGRPVERRELNAYDINKDRIIHHAVQHQFARVICAVKALNTSHVKRFSPFGYEQSRQPNGNLVLLGWSMVDCFEWQVERGEKPAVTYERDADGKTRLVQGVTA